MGWWVALVLYSLPVLAGIRHFREEVDDCKEWMRSDDGEWFPTLAPFMAALAIIAWPVFVALEAFTPEGRS